MTVASMTADTVQHWPASGNSLLGEGPVWVPDEQALYWVDIHRRKIRKLNPRTGDITVVDAPMRVGSLAPRAAGGFIAGSERGLVEIDARLSSFTVIHDPEPDLPGNRFNDGKVDPHGAFWAGTIDDAERNDAGSLYRWTPDLNCQRMDSGYRITNGPAFSSDGRTLYHCASDRGQIFRLRLNDAGEVEERVLWKQFDEAQGYPDGLTVDVEGHLWVAFWDGWCVRRLSPAADIVDEITLPVQRPTSCCFGGAAMDQLFITSASIGIDLDEQPLAGALFVARPGVAGPLPTPFLG